MRKKISNEKGITIIAVTLTVIIMIVILSVVTFYASNSAGLERFQNMKADIEEIETKALYFYLDKGVLPVKRENSKTRAEMNGDEEMFNPNDSDKYYLVSLSDLGMTTTAYKTDYYINAKTGTVYANTPVTLKGKQYARQKENYDLVKSQQNQQYQELIYQVPPEVFTYSGSAITGIDKSWINTHKGELTNYLTTSGSGNNFKVTFTKLVIPYKNTSGMIITKINRNFLNSGNGSGSVAGVDNIIVGSNITDIDAEAFNFGQTIKYIWLNATTTTDSFNIDAFKGAKITGIYFGPHVELPYAKNEDVTLFQSSKSSLERVWFATTSLGEYTCYGCQNLKQIILEDHLTEIPKYTFYGCSYNSLTILSSSSFTLGSGENWPNKLDGTTIFPKELRQIREFAFYDVKTFVGNLRFNTSTPNLEGIGRKAFQTSTGTSGITNVYVTNKTTYRSDSFNAGVTITKVN